MKREIKLTNELFFEYGEAIEPVLRRAVQHALLMHKRLGNSVAVWQDGKVLILPPDQIAVEDSLEDDGSRLRNAH